MGYPRSARAAMRQMRAEETEIEKNCKVGAKRPGASRSTLPDDERERKKMGKQRKREEERQSYAQKRSERIQRAREHQERQQQRKAQRMKDEKDRKAQKG